MRKIIYIALWFILSGCSEKISVVVIEDLENGQYHVASMTNDYSDVVELPDGTSEGDIVKIKKSKDTNQNK